MSNSAIDLKELLDRVQDDKELMLELFDIFIEDYQGKRKNLPIAVSEGDAEKVRSIAHSLKGASGNISAKSVREICCKLENMGKENKLSGADEVLKDLDIEYQKMVENIEELRKQFGK